MIGGLLQRALALCSGVIMAGLDSLLAEPTFLDKFEGPGIAECGNCRTGQKKPRLTPYLPDFE